MENDHRNEHVEDTVTEKEMQVKIYMNSLPVTLHSSDLDFCINWMPDEELIVKLKPGRFVTSAA